MTFMTKLFVNVQDFDLFRKESDFVKIDPVVKAWRRIMKN